MRPQVPTAGVYWRPFYTLKLSTLTIHAWYVDVFFTLHVKWTRTVPVTGIQGTPIGCVEAWRFGLTSDYSYAWIAWHCRGLFCSLCGAPWLDAVDTGWGRRRCKRHDVVEIDAGCRINWSRMCENWGSVGIETRGCINWERMPWKLGCRGK